MVQALPRAHAAATPSAAGRRPANHFWRLRKGPVTAATAAAATTGRRKRWHRRRGLLLEGKDISDGTARTATEPPAATAAEARAAAAAAGVH